MRHTESRIQQACVKIFASLWPHYYDQGLFIAIPNGGGRSRIEASILKGEGVRAGVADTFLFVPSGKYHGLAIEFKCEYTDTNGKTKRTYQRKEQKDWQAAIENQGYRYEVCRSSEDFVRIVNSYLHP